MPTTTVDPGGALAFVRGIVRVRGTGASAGVWHVGLFVNGVQVAHRAFVNKEWQTLEFGIVEIVRGDTADVRLYRLAGEASAPAQIAEWRLESLSHLGCNPYSGGPLEGGIEAEGPPLTSLEARFLAHLEAVEAGLLTEGEGVSDNFVDPSEWGPAPEEPAPPWEDADDPLNPGPAADYQFRPYLPDA
ncbi:MAG: hypothetical protein H0U46_00185 [Actinobacteria bacterium]|nr:hypothetical protein [Actinomycetota bacterium]MBA3584954.1 hypothetical protein [Gemmatimonadota bacterium]